MNIEEPRVKNRLRTLCEAAVQVVQEAGEGLEAYRGRIAFYSPEWDDRFTSLTSFSFATTELDALPLIQAQCGPGESRRVALQFIYGYLGVLENPAFDANAFELTFAYFWKELSILVWTYMAVSNLQNFRSDSELLDLGDGISIQSRSFKKLAGILGWGENELDQLSIDWRQGASGSHVLLVEHKVRKSPENLILVDSGPLLNKAQRALLALRLHKRGGYSNRSGVLCSTGSI